MPSPRGESPELRAETTTGAARSLLASGAVGSPSPEHSARIIEAGSAGVRRIDALTGFRVLPALFVLLSHMGPPPSPSPRVKAFINHGYSGVTFFFVLSGFVLAHNYFKRFETTFSLRLLWSYLVARVARIYPLYLLLLVWVSLPALLTGTARMDLWVRHVFALQAWDADVNTAFAFNGPGWSISVELFLYACFPLLVFVLAPIVRRRWGIALALVAVAASMVAVTHWFVVKGYDSIPWTDPRSAERWLYRNPLCRLGDFTLGILVARLVASMPGPHRRIGRVAIGISVVAIITLMCSLGPLFSAASWDVSYALPAALLIFGLAIAPDSWPARALATRPMILLGEASYALYLCQGYMVPHIRVPGVPEGKWILVEAMTVLMIVAMAVGLHVTVERPCRRLVRRALDPGARQSSA
jgi:peptidoglycan/LPS O-acetylase OafA/YrhL